VTNRLERDTREEYKFDALVLSDKLLAQPGQQYAILGSSDMSDVIPPIPDSLRSSGQVALMLAFSPPQPVNLDMVRPSSGPLSLLVRDSSKPQRGGEGEATNIETWTARSTPDYADLHIVGEQLVNEAAVAEELRNAFFKVQRL
jgi:predicted NAD/FAD-dependent oxidoreductase